MKLVELTYEGPRDELNVLGYGLHYKGKKKEYPEEQAEYLLSKERHMWTKGKVRGATDEEDAEPETIPEAEVEAEPEAIEEKAPPKKTRARTRKK